MGPALTAQNPSPPTGGRGCGTPGPARGPRGLPTRSPAFLRKPAAGRAEDTAGSRGPADASTARGPTRRVLPASLPARTGLSAATPKQAGATGRNGRQSEVDGRPAGWTRAQPSSHRTRWAPGPAGKRSARQPGAERPAAGPGGPRARREAPHAAPAPPPSPRCRALRRQQVLKRRGPEPASHWPAPPLYGPIRGGSAVGGGVGGRESCCACARHAAAVWAPCGFCEGSVRAGSAVCHKPSQPQGQLEYNDRDRHRHGRRGVAAGSVLSRSQMKSKASPLPFNSFRVATPGTLEMM